MVFSSAETGVSSYFNNGFKRRLGGALDSTGFVLMGATGIGIFKDREIRDGQLVRIDHLSNQSSVLIGYQWMVGNGVWALFAGGEGDMRQPLIDGVLMEQAEPRFGVRLQAEAWIHPSDRTLATGTVIAGTARPHLWARAAWGYRIWRNVHLGPEASLSLEPDYLEGRLGVHATGLRIGRFNLRLSGGLLLQNQGDPAGYAALSTYFKL